MTPSSLLADRPSSQPPPFSRRASSLVPSAIREILKAAESPEVISFAGGLPAAELFPHEEVAIAVEKALSDTSGAALQYSVTEGFGPLRRWIADYSRQTSGLLIEADSVLVTHGSQQALDLIAKVLLDPGDTVLTEDPAYLGALQVFRLHEAHVVGLPSDRHGLIQDALDTYLRHTAIRPKFVYLTPTFQNPTGSCLSPARRAALAAIADAHGLWVVEDDPYHALRYSGIATKATVSHLAGSRWIHLGSTSKILAPGLRVGWLATPCQPLFAKLVAAKQASDLHTGTLAQRTVHEFVRDPDRLRNHVTTLIIAYSRRRDTLARSLERELAGAASWALPEGGLFLWLTLADGLDARRLLEHARKRDVVFVPGESFWVGEKRPDTLRLNFSHPSEDRIKLGVARLARALAEIA